MPQIKSLAGFKNYRRLVMGEPADGKPCLVICAGTGGQASGSNDIMRIIKREMLEHELHDRISLRTTGCLGFCEMDPFIIVEPGCHLYPKLKMDDVPAIIEATLKGQVVDELLYREPGSNQPFHAQREIPFFRGQTRTILGNNQRLDPIRIVDYIRVGGYAALEKVLDHPDTEWIIREVQKSGLRGRGGAGFPTGKKWELARQAGAPGVQKFIVCNADEGDPGAYMDRSLLEGNPHAILEGMVVAGIAIGATRGIIYVRSEYPLAIKHALLAVRQMRELGLLGTDILGTGVCFDVEIVRGAGAFVCGEETALIRSIEGKMGEPRQRPPYPIEKGIYGCPTCINNVETLANVAPIISGGADQYVKVGVPGNTGTKIFSLVGKIKNTGLVEVPMGTTIGEIVYGIGGGPVGKAKVKAVQTGGPSGGCIPAARFDLPIDYDSLAEAGSIMGSGGMIVMDENTCMVDITKYFMNFLQEESCGKCFTCRKGTQRMHEILEDITRGDGTADHLALLEELAQVVKDTTMCGLGQSAPNPVLSTLRYFREEYERHIVHKRCDAFVCKELVGAPCQSACPLGTEAWRYVAHIARGEFVEAYRVIRETNPLPSVCARVCHHPCEERCRLGAGGYQEPLAIRALKRVVTDQVGPESFRLPKLPRPAKGAPKVAIIGAGPAGLAAGYHLSQRGYPVTVFEAESEPGGMALCGIPAYRLPREVLKKEIAALLNENITLRCNATLGRDVTIDGLQADGFQAIFLALGAHKSQRLNLPGQDAAGVFPAMQFLKAFNLREEKLARGRVGIIGGGNSGVDAARIALRQPGVESVTIYYRRTRDEMPAFTEEIEAALAEGVKLELLVSPVAIHCADGRVTGLELVRTNLGEFDASGRRRPVAQPGTEYAVAVDTLIVAIGEQLNPQSITDVGIERKPNGAVWVNPETLQTSRTGVFAGGDVVTGPNTVVDALAAGKKAARMIEHYLRGEALAEPHVPRRPKIYLEPVEVSEEERATATRAAIPMAPAGPRASGFVEAEFCLPEADAVREARRCLRCDLEFTRPAAVEAIREVREGKPA
jgi:NADH-quinone oxidoreductase subunit F